jgi:hypothetical protein
LTSGVSQAASAATFATFDQQRPFWTAVGVRPPAGEDWDLGVYDTFVGSPACATGQQATSTAGVGVVDFIVGDFNHNLIGTYIADCYPYSGTNPATIEWDDGPDAVTINDFGNQRTTGANDVLECFDVFLFAGKSYSISIGSTGNADVKLFFFRNPANATAWLPRSAATFSLASTTQGVSTEYTAPASDWYAIVVVNENGADGWYNFRVDSCLDPITLTSGVTQVASRAPSSYAFTQVAHYWSAAAVRTTNPAQDWQVALWHGYAAGQAGGCWTSLYDWSTLAGGKVNLVAIDFNMTPTGTVYVEAIPTGLTSVNARVEWDDGADLLNLNADPLVLSTGPDDLVRIWDVWLDAGQTYRILFSPLSTTGGEAPKCWALLFRNHQGAFPYSAERQFADVQTQGNATYAAPASGYYGLAVVNDDGAEGQYTLGLFNETVDSPVSPLASLTRLVSIAPNPARANARVRFELARAGSVRLDLVDVAGRVRDRLEVGVRGPGPAEVPWALETGGDRASRRPAGVYFVRLVVDGRPVGVQRLVVLGGGDP